ncbi:MAG: hypothetical protein PVH77_08735 [Phycisphaerales bacterium]|jgi:hypothetical protein
MDLKRRIILVFIVSAITSLIVMPCYAQDDENIWDEGRPPEPGRRQGRGPNDRDREPPEGRMGPGERRGRMGRGLRRFEPSKEEIDKILKELKQKDPAKSKELETLREKDTDKYRAEIGKLVFERRMEFFRKRWEEEFLAWLEKVKPREAQKLAGLKDQDAELYTKKFNHARRKYWRIFEEGKRFPELEEVLLADMELEERQDVLVSQIKAAKNEDEKQNLTAKLQEVVGAKYDLIIRRKQIAYEQLLKRLEEIQREINISREEISKWKNEELKKENVEIRLKDLLERGRPRRFRWD